MLLDLWQSTSRRCAPPNLRDGATGVGSEVSASRGAQECGFTHAEGTSWVLWDPDEAEAGKEGKF